ncbi:dynein axonemal heavy chain 5-like isoform X4 [Apostichopus japonicus]|uniref:dynein axonemal heavy chain 5-like isoform X4 n=1 Tax=Stichopus japonicus TaxID=307972 RepID=UPI003AB53672
MDERHWWIATKIQESFHIGGFGDNPTLLEDFLCEPQTLELINQFLGAGGTNKLFFYSDRPQSTSVNPSGLQSTRQLHVVNSLATLKGVNIEETTCLYFLRHDVSSEVDPVRMEKDIFCGELRHSVLDNLNTVLSDIFLPLLKAQKDWGKCSYENVNQCLTNLERYAGVLAETVNVPASARQQVLRRPDNLVSHEFSKHRTTSYDQGIITEYEALVNEWISTIDNALADGGDERFMDPTSGPLSELDRWRRRQRMLSSIMEQLKGKECKMVIGVLITTKSKVLKKWKAIDASITDAANETKDKVKYLESLRRYFEQLYNGATPTTMLNSALPGLMNNVKQMDSISRFYARSGYLGLLFVKITNQIVNACKGYIQRDTFSLNQEDILWKVLFEEIRTKVNSSEGQPSKTRASRRKDNKDVSEDESLFGKLKACVQLYGAYKDMVRNVRDSLGGVYTLTTFPSISSLGAPTSSRQNRSLARVGASHGKASKTPSVAGESEHGISFADEESLFGHLDTFCSRLRQLLEVIHTLVQYGKLAQNAEGLPRPRKDDLAVDEGSIDEPLDNVTPGPVQSEGDQVSSPLDPRPPLSPVKTSFSHLSGIPPIAEEEELGPDSDQKEDKTEGSILADDQSVSDVTYHADEVHDLVSTTTGLSSQNALLLKKLYNDLKGDREGPSLTSIITDHIHTIRKLLSENVTTAIMLDVESSDKDKFDFVYQEFLTTVQQLEMYLCAYIHAIFLRKMKTHEALNVLTRFDPVMHRQGMKRVVSDKYVDIFIIYESDLEAVKDMYEQHKSDPPLVRNAPQVAGSVHWSRQLLQQIEEPMKVFRDNRAVSHLRDYLRIVKFYNRIATALVTFESLWLNQWKSQIDLAKVGLRSPILAVNPETSEVLVNVDERILQLMQECRWMHRLQIEVPQAAIVISKQEQRFKKYNDHLQLCLQELGQIRDDIRTPVQSLFASHIGQVHQALQPGLTSIAWNSMNIDAFLHQAHAANAKLRETVSLVNHVIDTKIESKLKALRELFLFDMNAAFERSWPPSDFSVNLVEGVNVRSEQLKRLVEEIQEAVHEVVNILLGSKKPVSNVSHTLSASSRRSTPKVALFTPRSGETVSSEPRSGENVLISELLTYYSELVYHAVLSSVCRSLITLAEAAGCEGVLEEIATDIRNSQMASGAISEEEEEEDEQGEEFDEEEFDENERSVSRSRTKSRASTAASSRYSHESSVRSESSASRHESSRMSFLSDMSWTSERVHASTHLRFEVAVKFAIPNIIIEPTLDHVKKSLTVIAESILKTTDKVTWWGGERVGESFLFDIEQEVAVNSTLKQLKRVVTDLQQTVDQHLFHFRFYDFLWRDDMYGTYYDFISNDPGTMTIKREVERLLHIENKIKDVPDILPVGPICLETRPIRDALYGFAVQWKSQYAQVLHEEAKRKLDNALLYRANVQSRLQADVTTLDQLNSTLTLLEEVRDMENKIDGIYLPIETIYDNLRSYKLRLPRTEVHEVEALRDSWQMVLDLAEECRVRLLREKRGAFEQELDKQVKLFVVEVIQFRNSFDSQGPAVPGVQPAEAVARLHEFQEIFKLYDSKRKTLDSVSRLFGIICKPFPELDKTGEELDLLGLLYGLFQKFIAFDGQFRDRLWADADLSKSNSEVETYWEECQNLPSKLKDWDAFNEMKNSIKFYLDVFPILHKLASKEIRNRHWLQVMSVTGSSFQLEANVFKLCHILDAGLIEHQVEIEEICHCASKELELEVKLRITEEEWTEQVLMFVNYKNRGPIFLEKDYSEHLLEQLENAQAILANMLTSKYVGPLREEAAGWAEKLRGVSEVLEQWLEVQDLWQYLEAVFSIPRTAKELPQEAKRFSRLDRSWTKIMKRAYDTRNVLQCTYGGEIPKGVVLRHIYDELEICFKSLMGYLDKKRQAFPRFYFLSDPVLLAVLSRPLDLESVRPHLRCLFNYVYDIHVDSSGEEFNQSPSPLQRIRSIGSLSPQKSPTKEIRLSPAHDDIKRNSIATSGGLSQEEEETSGKILQAVSISSKEGEMLQLQDVVDLKDGVEVWLMGLKESIAKTVHMTICKMIEDMERNIPIEELAYSYPTQVALMGLMMYWTKECELGILELRNERRALPNASKKFISTVSKMTSVLTKGNWKNLEESVTPLQRLRLENMVAQCPFLRDTLDHLAVRKLRELGDFEWRRCIRFYYQRIDGRIEPEIYIFEDKQSYGNEFFGGQSSLVMTPLTERCFLTLSMCLRQLRGAAITGATGVGKTETVKGLAYTLGRYLALFGCSPNSDPLAMGKMVQGLAMDGSWGCFDEFQLLNAQAVAVVLDHVQAVLTALKARSKKCFLADGEEVQLNGNIAFFVTVNNEQTGSTNQGISNDIKLLFRTVCLAAPDIALILKAKCAAYGFRSPKVLADRLKMVVHQCRDQLNPDEISLFNMKTLSTVLLRSVATWHDVEGSKEYHNMFSIGAIANTIEQAKMGRRLTKEERMVLSRASSQNSLVQPGSAMPSAAMLKTVEKVVRKPGVPNPMTPSAKAEHAVVAQALHEVIGPRLKPDAAYIFGQVVKDIFSGVGDPPTPLSSQAQRSRMNIEQMISEKALESGFTPSTNWLKKCMQLYTVSQVNHGVIVAGGPGTGKSSCIQVLVDALSAMVPAVSRQQSRNSVSSITAISHKLQRINPLVVDDLNLMFGQVNQNQEFVDGVFTNIWRKANRNVSTTWLCLDGPLTNSWADNFNSVLEGDKVLHLHNGDRLNLSDNVKLLFETTHLMAASPATVARTGIVFFDRESLGWRPIAQSWLDSRNQQEVHCLQKAFNKTMDGVVNFVLYDTKPLVNVCEAGMFKMCIGLLEAMLNEHISIGGELHIERLYLFCLIWSFGGLLQGTDRKNFSELLRTLTSALPDYDHEISVYDYYVDESGEWDPWVSKVPEVAITDHRDLLGEIFVDTVDTIRTRVILEFANLSNMHVLLVGPPGCGKTVMINDFINTLDPSDQVTKRLVFSGASTATDLQQFIETNIYHRQGFVYGAKDNKRLQVFIDDLNLPPEDEGGVQRCNELLRQLLDDRALVGLQKPFEWRTIEDLVVLSSFTKSHFPSVVSKAPSDRLMRHFAVVFLPEARDSTLHAVVDALLDGNMTKHNGQGLAQELHDAIVHASCQLLTTVQNVLRPSTVLGRFHYMFTLRDITKAFQCLMRLSEEARGEISMVASLWRHEVQRIMRDRLCRKSDLNWFDQNLQEVVKAYFPQVEEGEGWYEDFVTFPIEPRAYQRPVTSMSQKTIRVVLQPVPTLEQVHKCVHSHLTRYNEEFGNVTINIMLSDHVIYHVIRIHRILSFHHGGNMLMIGAIGNHLTTLVNLALHVADMPTHPIDSSRSNTFFDGLRSAVRLSGTEGKMLTLLFTGRDLRQKEYLNAVNSLLVAGEYPQLFSNDELESLLAALTPAMKRNAINTMIDPMKFFVSRVKTNLHIILCIPPTHHLLRIAASQYPGLLTGMQVNWNCDWAPSALLGEAKYFMQKHNLAREFSSEIRENLVNCIAGIHGFVLRDCNQIPWAGSTDDTITITTLKLHGKKEQVKAVSTEVPNLPYTKAILRERIRMNHYSPANPGKHELFVGPRTFRRFMDCFRYILNKKSKENTSKVSKLRKALSCLSRTHHDTKVKRQEIKRLQVQYEEASARVADLLKQLTAKATVLEKTKAQFEDCSLSAFLQMNDIESEEDIEDELLAEEERDEYDREFERLREENLKTRRVAIEEELAEAQRTVTDCRNTLQKAREQVYYWRDQVDRTCIEKIRSYQNPPQIVLQVMEMVMALFKKNKPASSGHHRSATERLPNEDASILSGSSSPVARSPTKMTGKVRRESLYIHKGRDALDEKKKWKQMQVLMNDSVKFIEMLYNLDWENGLPPSVMTNVEIYLPAKKEGEGVTGEGSLLDLPGGPKLPASSRRSPTPAGEQIGITIGATRYSSEDAANLVAFVCALMEYSYQCGPLRDSLNKLVDLQKEKEETERLQRVQEELEKDTVAAKAEPEEEKQEEEEEIIYSEADIPMLEEEVTKMQGEFDAAVVVKHKLDIELSASNERLKAATSMIHSLRAEGQRWKAYVDQNAENEWLLTNCLVASAYLAYCGAMTLDSRNRLADIFKDMCGEHKLHVPKKQLFIDIPLINFLYDEVEIESLRILKLPRTENSNNNASFILQEESCSAWPLICDPTSRVLDWLYCYLSGKLVIVKYNELRSQLESCLTEGTPLVLMDCDPEALAEDARFMELLRQKRRFWSANAVFKMMVADHEVECHPGFHIYFHTTYFPHLLPHSLAAYTSPVYFYQGRADVEEELLDRFMALEKARLDEDRITAIKEQISNMTQLNELEKQMLDCLASDTRLLNDLAMTRKLADMKKHYDETLESQERVQISENAIHNAREGYRAVAKRGAVCFDVSRSMVEINPIYQTSWQQFLEVYDVSIKHSERSAVKAVVDKLTSYAFQSSARALLEKDRFIYAFLLSLEVEDSLGRVGVGEREFLISPQLGSAVMNTLGHTVASDHRVTQIKKPFDWMFDEQFHNLQSLALHYEWFQDMFERMPKDGRETQWRTLGEHGTPEVFPLPEKMDETYHPLQRLLVLRAFRPDRVQQCSVAFVSSVLGKRYIQDINFDIHTIVNQSSPRIPILLLYTREGDLAQKMFNDVASKKQSHTVVVALNNSGPTEERKARKAIKKAMQDGSWVLLQHGHNAVHLMNLLETILEEGDIKNGSESNFRVWISAQMRPELPVRLLQIATKAIVDTSRMVRNSLVGSISQLDQETLKHSGRTEWPPLLHNLAMLHAAVRLRALYGMYGWNYPATMDFSFNEIHEAIMIAKEIVRDIPGSDGETLRGISWIGLRYLLSEVVYGSHITNEYDQTYLSALVDYWTGPNSVKRDFEATKMRYRTPAAFFNNHIRQTTLLQSLDQLPLFMMEVPEACCMHTTMEDDFHYMTVTGIDQYVMTRVNAILDAMPSSNTLSHVLQPIPLSPKIGPSVASVTGHTLTPAVASMGVYASASQALVNSRKDIEIWEVCHSLIGKIPRGWNREYVVERIRKTGADTPFNRFILREIDLMLKLLAEIKSSLQKLKSLTENPTELLGDQMSEKLVRIADDIFHHRIPSRWLHLSGESAPPANWALGQWLADLSARCQQLERIIIQGREKFPAYWLGGFFHPRCLLALLKQDAIKNSNATTNQVEPIMFQTEITSRDKDHVRDPPSEGMFVYGVYLWGCTWEKTTGELQDAPPKSGPTPLPIIHITCTTNSDKVVVGEQTKTNDTFYCPVYQNRITPSEPVFFMDVRHESVSVSKWALRGLAATVRPF